MERIGKNLPARMKAAVVTRYGSPEVIRIMEVPLPELKPNMVIVRVEAAAVNSADARTRALQAEEPIRTLMRLALGFHRPRQPILGTVYAGTIVAIGKKVHTFKVGDRVFGATPGMLFGCHAEYVAVPEESAIALVPEGKDPAEIASLVFGGTTALFFLERAGAAPGKHVLIYGASGAVGSMALQIAHNLGMHVTGVASAKNESLVISLGADQFLDYTQPNFQLPLAEYDLVFDAVGKLPRKLAKRFLRQGGTYTTVGGASVSKENKQQLERLVNWYLSGKLQAVIEARFAFEDIQKAHALVDSGHKRGNVILMMQKEEQQ